MLSITSAIAQTPPVIVATSTSVVFGDALAAVLTICVPTVAAILSGALWKLWTKFGLEATAQDKANMETELQAALAFGVAKALPEIKARGWDSVDMHSVVLADAATYFLQRFPDRTKIIADAAGIIPMREVRSAVTDTLHARLPEALAVAATSPATPILPIVVPIQP